MTFNLDLCGPYRKEIELALLRVFHSQRYIFGPEVKAFEEEWAAYTGQAYTVGVGSGTDAIRIALLALGIGPGDEVISPAFNVAYTALAVAAIGAKNVFVDCNPFTMLMDEKLIEAAITPRTRAIVPVHLFGSMCSMDYIRQVADKYKLLVVEDAAQAHGHSGVGLKAHATAYSFYPTKNLGALGEAGAVTTNIDIVAERARLLRDGGRTDRYLHMLPGINSGLDEIQAAVLRVKLPHLNKRNFRRAHLAGRYREGLTKVGDLRLPTSDVFHVYHLFVVRTAKRDALREHLTRFGIPSLIHYPVPVPYQPCFATSTMGSWPNAEEASRTVLSLPMHADLGEAEQDGIIDIIRDFYS
jgi:dTDP-3-amino-3,6-dideoxy-alpha-D-glucopyranose transaminase